MERLKQLWQGDNRDVVLDGNRYVEIGYTTYDISIHLFRENGETVFSVGVLRSILKNSSNSFVPVGQPTPIRDPIARRIIVGI